MVRMKISIYSKKKLIHAGKIKAYIVNGTNQSALLVKSGDKTFLVFGKKNEIKEIIEEIKNTDDIISVLRKVV